MDSKLSQKKSQIKKHTQVLMDGDNEISLTDILSTDACQQVLSGCREFRDRIYTPITTIYIYQTGFKSRQIL